MHPAVVPLAGKEGPIVSSATRLALRPCCTLALKGPPACRRLWLIQARYCLSLCRMCCRISRTDHSPSRGGREAGFIVQAD